MKFLGALDPVSQRRTESCNLKLVDPARLQAIRETGLMDTPREEAFDRLARLAAEILDVPLTIFSLVDAHKQFFKADFGLPSPFKETRELPIDASLCRYTLEGQSIISNNAAHDPFLKLHPSTGPWGIVAIIVLPLITDDGHVLGTFCAIQPEPREWTDHDLNVMKELTASIMTEINLRRQIARLQAEQNLRDTFVAALTHDLRTPVTAAQLSMQILARQFPDIPGVQTQAQRALQSLKGMERMIRDLLDATQIRTGKPLMLRRTEFDLVELAQQTIQDLALIYSDRFVLKADLLFAIWADQGALRRILENLLSNAAKYGAKETPIELIIEKRTAQVRLQVRNQGNPIPKQDLATVFEPFHRSASALESAQKGWGLGLPLVRGLAEAHGGSVSVTSTEEEGTCFTVSLPNSVELMN